jgi:hypothetical protein
MNLTVAQKVKIRAVELGLNQTEIAKETSRRLGARISLQRFNDGIHGRRPNDWFRMHTTVAAILKMNPSEIRNAEPPAAT